MGCGQAHDAARRLIPTPAHYGQQIHYCKGGMLEANPLVVHYASQAYITHAGNVGSPHSRSLPVPRRKQRS